MTANHVLKYHGQNSTINLIHPNREVSIQVDIVGTDTSSDLAILKITSANQIPFLEYKSQIPNIGSEVCWGGYPVLIGENPEIKFRAAKGIIESRPNLGVFEVDGIFNPGHSGGPVIEIASEKVVGVINARAGSPKRILGNLNFIGENLKLLADLIEKGAGSMMSTNLTAQIENLEQLKSLMIRAGLQNRIYTPTGNTNEFSFLINSSEGMVAAVKNLIEIYKLISIVLTETYQIGLGIATGGTEMISMIKPVYVIISNHLEYIFLKRKVN